MPHIGRGMPLESRGKPRQARGSPHQRRGLPHPVRGEPQSSRGWPLELKSLVESAEVDSAPPSPFHGVRGCRGEGAPGALSHAVRGQDWSDNRRHDDMARHDFIPRRDFDFLEWSRAFRDQIVADPVQFGLTPLLAAQYDLLFQDFANKYRTASQASTSTRPAVLAKNESRRALEAESRRLSRLIQATAGVTEAQKRGLGLTVRDTQPTPLPRPATPPRVSLKLLYGSTIRVTLRDLDSPRRGKPAGIAGATVFTHVGNLPPDSLSKWRMEGVTTRPTMDVTIGNGAQPVAPGAKVWVTAYWQNPRGQRGPAASPQYTHIQCQTLRLENAGLRMAA